MFFLLTVDIKREPSSQSGYVILSESVGVTLPKKFGNTSGPIQIVHDLEVNYKPRYKSDYFSQHGNIRPPRYVADRLNNHYVSIRVIELQQNLSFIYYLCLLFCRSHWV